MQISIVIEDASRRVDPKSLQNLHGINYIDTTSVLPGFL
jgi:hypothetical protein